MAFWYTIRTVDWEDLSRLRFLQPKFDLVQCDILHSRVVWVVSDSRWSSAKDEGLGVLLASDSRNVSEINTDSLVVW